ncbi:nuclear transport factor 2 family protein [Streptomyces sp. NBC_00525]|uniref:nuclear transport factor 2 family protein n=1 Tax=Streptomyces sp. NBC_00525 TaxID=2903660 RepID=UPI002E80AE8C|nr:nuclear transport factor 2 family protein [Streptomyces sp. NBC_00525]WUC95183.1 nuclear transport factor 2 family protein [Streptomyces sp. NBC_00525]
MTARNTTSGINSPDNKTLVSRALATLLETGGTEALAPVLSDGFRHHRPGGHTATKAEWLAAVEAAIGPTTGMKVEIDHLLADGEHVVVHSRRELPGGPQIVVVDIWRIEGGLIAEGWEIIEPVAAAAANLSWWAPADR